MLEFQHVTKKQGNFVLSDINFQMEEGFLLGIVLYKKKKEGNK